VRVVAVLTAVLVVVAGCGKGAPARQDVPEPGPPVWVAAECEGPVTGTEKRGGIPTDFTATSVLRCTQEIRDQANVLVTERTKESVAKLTDLLRKPSDPLTNDVCTADLQLPPHFLLVDAAGRALLPQVPTDPCGKPRREVVDLLKSLTYERVAEVPLGTVPPTEGEAGCSTEWKDEIALGGAKPGPATALWPEPVDALKVCVYNVDKPQVGSLESGRVVEGERSQALRDALAEAGPAGPCTSEHTRFAVLHPKGKATWATIELDGCLRVLRPNQTLGQVNELVTGLLTGP
jgi:hypothetical protein